MHGRSSPGTFGLLHIVRRRLSTRSVMLKDAQRRLPALAEGAFLAILSKAFSPGLENQIP